MIGKGKSVLLETKAKIAHIFIVLITMYGYENETVKKADRENLIYFKYGVGWELYRYPGLRGIRQVGPRAN